MLGEDERSKRVERVRRKKDMQVKEQKTKGNPSPYSSTTRVEGEERWTQKRQVINKKQVSTSHMHV